MSKPKSLGSWLTKRPTAVGRFYVKGNRQLQEQSRVSETLRSLNATR